MVPPGDFLGQALLDGRAGLADPREAPLADLRDVLGHDVGDGLAPYPLFELASDPGALGTGEEVGRGRLVFREGAVVEVRRVMEAVRASGGVDLHVQHAPGDRAAFAVRQGAGVPDTVLQGEQHAGVEAGGAFVHQDRAAPEEVASALQGEVQDGVEEGVAGTDEGGGGLPSGEGGGSGKRGGSFMRAGRPRSQGAWIPACAGMTSFQRDALLFSWSSFPRKRESIARFGHFESRNARY